MPRYSLRFLLLAVSLLSAVLALVFTPRGRISETTIRQLPDGISVEKASENIGLPPGWYDGVGTVSGLPIYGKGDLSVEWLNSRGAIIGVKGDGLQKIEFLGTNELSIGYSLDGLLYDRTFMRLYDSTSVFATIAMLGFAFLLPAAPILLIAWLRNYSVREFLSFGIMLSTGIFVLFRFLTGSWWRYHKTPEFQDLSALIAGTTFIALFLLLCSRIIGHRNKPDSERNTDVDIVG